jgi:hypothetical protein
MQDEVLNHQVGVVRSEMEILTTHNSNLSPQDRRSLDKAPRTKGRILRHSACRQSPSTGVPRV